MWVYQPASESPSRAPGFDVSLYLELELRWPCGNLNTFYQKHNNLLCRKAHQQKKNEFKASRYPGWLRRGYIIAALKEACWAAVFSDKENKQKICIHDWFHRNMYVYWYWRCSVIMHFIYSFWKTKAWLTVHLFMLSFFFFFACREADGFSTIGLQMFDQTEWSACLFLYRLKIARGQQHKVYMAM